MNSDTETTYKRLSMTIAAIIVQVAGRWGFELDQVALAWVIGPLIAWIVSQGFSDSGKEAKKLDLKIVREQKELEQLKQSSANFKELPDAN